MKANRLIQERRASETPEHVGVMEVCPTSRLDREVGEGDWIIIAFLPFRADRLSAVETMHGDQHLRCLLCDQQGQAYVSFDTSAVGKQLRFPISGTFMLALATGRAIPQVRRNLHGWDDGETMRLHAVISQERCWQQNKPTFQQCRRMGGDIQEFYMSLLGITKGVPPESRQMRERCEIID